VICLRLFAFQFVFALLASSGCNSNFSEIELVVGKLPTNEALDVFSINIVLVNRTRQKLKIHGVHACCSMQLDDRESKMTIDARSSTDLKFRGVIPDWTTMGIDQFEWQGAIFVEDTNKVLRKLSFTVAARKPGS